ncbi:unnamed protein product [Sympodiomycopsis kandeliae]
MPSVDTQHLPSRSSTNVKTAAYPCQQFTNNHISTDSALGTNHAANKMPSSLSTSAGSSPLASPSLPTRPRHHSRSVSQEAARFTSTIESFHLSPPRRSSHHHHNQAASTAFSFKPIGTSSSAKQHTSSPPSTSSSSTATPTHTPPLLVSPSAASTAVSTGAQIPSAAQQQSQQQQHQQARVARPRQSHPKIPFAAGSSAAAQDSSNNSSSADTTPSSEERDASVSDSTAATTPSTHPSSPETSPNRKRAVTAASHSSVNEASRPAGTSSSSSSSSVPSAAADSSALPSDDEIRLQQLLQIQASRRPKLMRLTPAFASLPGRFHLPAPAATNLGDKAQVPSSSSSSSTSGNSSGVAFPSMERSQSHSPATTPSSSSSASGRKGTAKMEPPAGLLALDMSNLPTPSPHDSSAPQSTSDLPQVRTKSGRLIKPSLKHTGSTWAPSSYTERADSGPPAMQTGSLRAKSTPNTPSIPKVVQFDTHLERVKVFKFKQRPTAISRSGSPEQTETETEEEREMFPFVNYGRRNPSPPSSGFVSPRLASSGGAVVAGTSPAGGAADAEEQLVLRLPNFPSSARLTVDREVFLERIYLADDLRSVKGTVRVKNISFEKWVAVRFTLDSWVTVNEVSADYSESLTDGQSDRFSFSIKLNELLNWPRGAGQHESKTMFLCLRYTTSSGEFWDNNDGLNYQLDFRKRQMPSTPTPTPSVGRPSSRSQTISGPTATAQQARIIEMAKRTGVQAGKGGSFVDDLRRELDKLRSDGEDEDGRPPIVTKKMVADAALGRQMLAATQRNSPPLSPGGRKGGTSPMWSARYDWGESFRNSSNTNARARPSAYDYFNAKPPPAVAAIARNGGAAASAEDGGSPLVQHNSTNSSAEATPVIRGFGQTRSGMFSPAVGDVIAHHKPISASLESSATSSPTKLSGGADSGGSASSVLGDGHLSVPSSRESRDGRSSPGNGASPTSRGSSGTHSRYFSFPPQRRGASSPYASENNSLEGSDEEEDQADPQYSRSPAVRISTMPKSSVKVSCVTDRSSSPDKTRKDNGLVLENYDDQEAAYSPVQRSPPSPSIFSPSASISSVESDITVGDETAQGDWNSTTPRIAAQRQWSSVSMQDSDASDKTPTNTSAFTTTAPASTTGGSGQSSSDNSGIRPRSSKELSELIQKYCWSNETTPGTAPLPLGLDPIEHNSKPNGKELLNNTHLSPHEVDFLSTYRLSSPPISGSATPTLDL